MAYKTIADLNSKWWYRLFKVLYVLFFITLITIANFFVYTLGITNIDYDKTLVRCDTPGHPEPFSLASTGVKIDKVYFDDKGIFDYKEYFNEFHEYQIKIYIGCLS